MKEYICPTCGIANSKVNRYEERTVETTVNLEDNTLDEVESYVNSVEYLCINCGVSIAEEDTLNFFQI